MFIFSQLFSESSEIGSSLTWDMRSGVLLLPTPFLLAPMLRFIVTGWEIFLVSRSAVILCFTLTLQELSAPTVLQLQVPKPLG